MKTKIIIENLYGIKQGTVDDLAQLSILVGPNNSGKSTILEGFYINTRRVLGVESTDFQIKVFEDSSSSSSGFMGPCALIKAATITQVSALEDAYSEVAKKGKEDEINAFLSSIDDGNPILRLLKWGGEFILHIIREDREPLFVYLEGDGFKRLLLIACQLACAAGGLVLLEEPECFQHPLYIRKLATLIWDAIEQGTQIIMSTHSLELLGAIFQAEGVPLDRSAIFRTSLKNDQLKVVRIPGERVAERLEDLGEDLRL